MPARVGAMTTYFATDPTEVRLSVSAVVRRAGEPGKILLMKRSDNGHWGLPGGYMEPGESVKQAARREVLEETGYQVELGRLVGVYSDPKSHVVEYPDHNRVQIVNLCFEALAGEAGEPTTPEEVLELGFFETEALPQPFVPIHTIRVSDALRRPADAAIR